MTTLSPSENVLDDPTERERKIARERERERERAGAGAWAGAVYADVDEHPVGVPATLLLAGIMHYADIPSTIMVTAAYE